MATDIPQGPQREDPRLRSVAERFAAVGRPGAPARRALVPDRKGLLKVVIREIDETVLPRRIRIDSDTGASALLTVSNRRLVCLEGSTPDPAPAPEQDPAAAASWFVGQLETIFRGSRTIAFRITDRRPAVETSALSCSAAKLREAAGLVRRDAVSKVSFHHVLETFEAVADASILWRRGAAQAEGNGPEGLLDLLRRCARAQSNGRIGRIQFKPAVPTCALLSLDAAASLLIAEYQGDRFFAVVPPDRTGGIMRMWKAYTRSASA